MEMAAPVPVIFSRGFRFNPTPLESATYYLPRLVAGTPLHEAVCPVINHADVYGCEPADLARQFCPLPRTGHRFFFTHCKLQQPQREGKASRATRAAGSGSWHSQSVKDVVDHASVKVGEIRKLRYKKGGAYTDWLMDEYSCCLEDAVAGDRQFVLCNIYVSPRADQGSAARQESAAFFAPPAPAPVAIAQAAAPKRPAPQSAEPPCPKRMRGAVAPTPPVVQPAGYCTASFAPPLPYVPHIATSVQPPPPPVPTRLAAPPPSRSLEPAPPLTPPVVRSCHMPPVPTRLAAPPPSRSPAPTPLQPRSLPKQQAPPATLPVVRACHMPPVPTRLAAPPPSRSPAPTPLQPRSLPKQQAPPATLPVVRACHMPVEAPARHCQPPQPSVQRKQRTRDPFEAAELGDEAEEAAPDPKESPAALVDQEDDWAELEKCMDDAVPTAEGSTMTEDEMDQHLSSLLFEESPAALVDQEDDWAELEKCMDDAAPTAEGSTMTEDEMDQHLSSLLFEEEEIPDAIAAPAPAPASKGSKRFKMTWTCFAR